MNAPAGYELGSAYAKDRTGILYHAVQLKLDRPVTIKALRSDLKDDARARRLFLDERDVVMGLEHRNLLLTIDVGEIDGRPYFITESTHEPTLAEALRAGEPLRELRTVNIALGLARAIHYLDQRRLIYKNVRPQNVLLPRPGAPKLLTFRYVRRIEEAKSFRGANVQSGAYCAPELVRDDLGPVTIKANLYALGALLYQMLAGEPPVAGPSAEARAAHAAGDVPPLKEKRPHVRQRAHTIVNRLLSHDPGRRPDPGSAVALLEAYRNDPLLTRPLKPRRKRRRR